MRLRDRMTVNQETCPWSIAIITELGGLAVMVEPGLTHDEAAQVADNLSPLTLKVVRPGSGSNTSPDAYQTITGVNRLVYRHPPNGWVFAAVGHAFAVVVEATTEPGILAKVDLEPKRGRR